MALGGRTRGIHKRSSGGSDKRRFVVRLVRQTDAGPTRVKVVTQAHSPEQAKRFAAKRKPGFSIEWVKGE